jgi:uncharacterized protein HemX
MATSTTPRTAPGRSPLPGRTPPGRRTPPPGRGTPRPVDAPRHTRPSAVPSAAPSPRPASPRPASRPSARPASPPPRPGLATPRPRHPRAPFILLLLGLLGGALVCLLVISTTLAEGSYQVTGLQQQNANLARQEQLLTQEVAQASSPQQIAQEAEALGMRPNPNLQFINTKTGKVVTGHPSAADAQITVPGYTP